MKSILLFMFLLPLVSHADIKVVDGIGRTVMLAQPAKRVISLSPHGTELVYAAGAGQQQVVGAVSFSDYPAQARQLPLVGSYDKFDMEFILSLKPDLLVAWQSGNPQSQIDELIRLGFAIYITEPREFEDIARDMKQIGRLLGTQKTAEQAANNYLHELREIRRQYTGRTPVRVFYQVWNNPLFTVNGEHLISKVINLCGGVNVFNDLEMLSPQVSIESVMVKNPDVIFYGSHETRDDWSRGWRQWKNIKAVANNHLFGIHADLIVRHSPRVLQGARQMCEHLDRVRVDSSGGN
ncbi:MAG: iron complex transport system substrate-binding protein [Pseudomonadota bacterium]|nr:iron complex transport system substrate-binding protein [Pseudomonadota bacterium]